MPWNAPPVTSVTPSGTPMPDIVSPSGMTMEYFMLCGERNGIAPDSGVSSTPDFRGRTEPSAMNETSPRFARLSRMYSCFS